MKRLRKSKKFNRSLRILKMLKKNKTGLFCFIFQNSLCDVKIVDRILVHYYYFAKLQILQSIVLPPFFGVCLCVGVCVCLCVQQLSCLQHNQNNSTWIFTTFAKNLPCVNTFVPIDFGLI